MAAMPTAAAADAAPETSVAASLLERHRDWLARLVAARTGRRDAVDDVLQEVAVAVTRSTRPPRVEHEERPWLCMIAIRQCALFLRTSSRRARLLARAAEQVSHWAGNRPEDDPIFWLMGREDAALVTRAMASLAAEDRQVLEWKYVAGETYPELATRLGVPKHVAEYRVVAAKKRLRGLLVDIGLGEDETR